MTETTVSPTVRLLRPDDVIRSEYLENDVRFDRNTHVREANATSDFRFCLDNDFGVSGLGKPERAQAILIF